MSMSLYLLPTTDMLPAILDGILCEIGEAEKSGHAKSQGSRHGKKVMGQLEKIVDDDSKLAISLDVNRFKPNELKVDIDGRTLTVEGKQESKSNGSYSVRSFMRQWNLPEEVDVEQIKSSLTEDGHLSIEAPKVKSSAARSIPIQKAASNQKAAQNKQ